MIEVSRRAEVLARGAAQWRDPGSTVRSQARAALLGSEWSAPVIEAALDDVLWDLDAGRAVEVVRDRTPADHRPIVVILPGNIVGTAIACAYCAAAAGAAVLLKSPGGERHLAPVLARQFDELGPPLAGTVAARYWKGGDDSAETEIFASARRAIAFGSDATIADLRRRIPVPLVAYGSSYSVGLVLRDADLAATAHAAARDVCMFDQRGCMSPQTIYVEGDAGRALRFAHALASALRETGKALPRSRVSADEASLIAMTIRRLAVSALAPMTHGLDTLILGPKADGAPEFVVVVEPPGPPTHEEFGRIVAVKPCDDATMFSRLAVPEGARLETLGLAGTLAADLSEALARTSFSRICPLGEMQRPPFGYRPQIDAFA